MRPSYVLGGRAMEIVDGRGAARRLYRHRGQVSGDSPVLIDQYLRDAIEVRRRRALRRRAMWWSRACMQHIEEAGVHSGDSACTLPPYSLSDEIVAEMERQAEALAHGARRASG